MLITNFKIISFKKTTKKDLSQHVLTHQTSDLTHDMMISLIERKENKIMKLNPQQT
jgi:5-hydroxyisourate hydrolase-like protein (transthyretin family)